MKRRLFFFTPLAAAPLARAAAPRPAFLRFGEIAATSMRLTHLPGGHIHISQVESIDEIREWATAKARATGLLPVAQAGARAQAWRAAKLLPKRYSSPA